jgi:hypothetical protein
VGRAAGEGGSDLRILLPANVFEPQDVGLTDAEIADRYGLDEVRRAPTLDVSAAICIDGPSVGQPPTLTESQGCRRDRDTTPSRRHHLCL